MQNTPIIRLPNVEKEYGVKPVYGKLECAQPTGSHKDRETEYAVKEAMKKGFKKVGIASTGNAAISLAFFCMKEGLECHVYVPSSIDDEKKEQILVYNPMMHFFNKTYADVVKLSNEDIAKNGYYNANPGVCTVKMKGSAEIGAEIAELKPKTVVCPTNNGTHAAGVWQGLKEKGAKPAMIAAVCPKTLLATSIGGYSRCDGPLLDALIKESKGAVVTVTDDQIKKAMRVLVRDGVICEPSSAAAVAAIGRDMKGPLVVTITGSGLKFPKLLKRTLFNQ